MLDEPPTPANNTAIDQAFEARFATLFANSSQLCEHCGRSLKAIIHDEWCRIAKKEEWDPRNQQHLEDFQRLCNNLISMHRCYCKPTAKYDGGGRLGTKHSAKEEAMWQWHGFEPEEHDRRLV